VWGPGRSEKEICGRKYFGDKYRGADKSLARPVRKQATATEDFDFDILVLFIYITRLASNEIFSGVLISP